jgi:hypothetical protein
MQQLPEWDFDLVRELGTHELRRPLPLLAAACVIATKPSTRETVA